MAAEMPPLAAFPGAVRRQIRGKLLTLLSDLGVKPQIDEATGEIVVPFAELAEKLGMTEDEARSALGDTEQVISVPTSRLRPMQ